MSITQEQSIKTIGRSPSHSGILPRHEVDAMRRLVGNFQGHNGIRIHYDRNTVHFYGQGDLSQLMRWRISRHSDTHINVGAGVIVRRGNVAVWTSGGTGDVTGFSNGLNYIYVQLPDDESHDPTLIPDSVIDGADMLTDTTWPVDDEGHRYYVLGHVMYNSTTAKITAVKNYIFSDLYDDVDIPDSNSHNVGTSPKHKTLQRHPANDIHKGELEFFAIETALDEQVVTLNKVGTDITAKYTYPVQSESDPHLNTPDAFPIVANVGSSSSGTNIVIELTWGTREFSVLDGRLNIGALTPQAAVVLAGNLDTGSDPPVDWIRHTDLDFTGSVAAIAAGETNVDQDLRYFIRGSDATQNYLQGLGGGANTPSTKIGGAELIDLHDGIGSYVCQLLDESANITADWRLRKLLYDDWTVDSAAKFIIENVTAAAAVKNGALQIYGGFSFEEQSFGSDGSFTLDMLNSSEALHAYESANHFKLAGGNWAGYAYDGSQDIYFLQNSIGIDLQTTGGGDRVQLLNAAYGLEVTADTLLTGDVLFVTTDFKMNGTSGDTITDGTNLFENGVFTNVPGWSLIGIRVLPSGGGTPFNMNVLGRVT